MSIKINWDGNDFWVKVGNRKEKAKTSKAIIKFLEDSSATKWTWSMRAKRQVQKENNG